VVGGRAVDAGLGELDAAHQVAATEDDRQFDAEFGDGLDLPRDPADALRFDAEFAPA
jgi:hypothetical protein